MEIINKVKTLKTTDVKTFLSWEFNALKDKKRNTTKLENAIIRSGFSFPVITWNNYVIDGTGRKQAVQNLIKKGYSFLEIPYVEIEAENLQDAKTKALEVSSNFGQITQDSFINYIQDLDIDLNTIEIKFDEFIDLEKVTSVNSGDENSEWVGMPEFEKGDKGFKIILKFETLDSMEKFATKNNIEITKKTRDTWSG